MRVADATVLQTAPGVSCYVLINRQAYGVVRNYRQGNSFGCTSRHPRAAHYAVPHCIIRTNCTSDSAGRPKGRAFARTGCVLSVAIGLPLSASTASKASSGPLCVTYGALVFAGPNTVASLVRPPRALCNA
jgi:hypothetical protein